jgi:hypothetical protein
VGVDGPVTLGVGRGVTDTFSGSPLPPTLPLPRKGEVTLRPVPKPYSVAPSPCPPGFFTLRGVVFSPVSSSRQRATWNNTFSGAVPP